MTSPFARSVVAVVRTAAVACIALLSTGCLCTFERDWRHAQKHGIPCDNLAGLWEGKWESDHNGHRGTLRAIITKCSDGHYHARYFATFAVLIPYSYDTTHSATEGNGVTDFCGQEDLGCLAGGQYHTQGQANGRSFVARYKADRDHGTFRMCRVGCCSTMAGCGCSSTTGGCAHGPSAPGAATEAVLHPADAERSPEMK